MGNQHARRGAGGLLAAVLLVASGTVAGATGTARIHYRDGSEKTYTAVRISIDPGTLVLTSSDGAGTITIGKAACTKVAELIRCLPYDATLQQHGASTQIALQSGTVWLNLTSAAVAVPGGPASIAPRGVVLALKSKAGNSITLTGTADEIKI